MKKIFELKTRFVIIILFAVFTVVQAFSLIMSTDDIWWYNIDSLSDMFKKYSPNGRYLTNTITYLICQSTGLRIIVYIATLLSFFILIARVLRGSNRRQSWLPYFLSAAFIFLAPRFLYVHVFNWISGFTNYIISLIITFIYLIFCMPLFDGQKPENGIVRTVLCLPLGIIGAMCVENITFYNILLAVFVVTFVFFKHKKIHILSVSFLLGSITGAVVSLGNRNYNEIYSDVDNIGIRSFDLNFADCIVKVYNEIIFYFSRQFFFIHIAVSVALVILAIIRFKGSKQLPKYAPLCLLIIVGYAIYSILNETSEQLYVMTFQYKIRAFETALTFLYILSLCYMVYCLLSGGSCIRALIYLISTIIVTAPFIIANPISSRCFFADYFFWALFAAELFMNVYAELPAIDHQVTRIASISFVTAFVCLFSYVDLTNKFVDNFRMNYVKEQLETGQSKINFIKLPYEHNSFDPFNIVEHDDYGHLEKDGKIYSYTDLVFMTNGIDMSVYDKEWSFITMLDYNTLMESE